MPNYIDICNRWHQATVRNSPLAWDAIRFWLGAEATMARINQLDDAAEDLTVLSNLAHRHALDLYPQSQRQAA